MFFLVYHLPDKVLNKIKSQVSKMYIIMFLLYWTSNHQASYVMGNFLCSLHNKKARSTVWSSYCVCIGLTIRYMYA